MKTKKQKLLKMLLILCSMVISACLGISASAINIPGGASRYNGHYYYLYDSNDIRTWDGAEAFCNAQGGHLATISSQAENDFIYSVMRKAGYTSAYFGLYDASGTNTSYKWVTGEPFTYSNWHDGEPNGWSERYGMFYWKYEDGKWNDGDFGGYTVNGGRAFICEWDSAKEKITASAVKLSKLSYVYDGKMKIPSVTVTLNGKTLKKGTDYTVTYSGASQIGKAYVRVIGTGRYTGTVTKTYTIRLASPRLTVSSTQNGEAVVSVKKVTGADGYRIVYKNLSTGKSYSKDTSALKTTLKNLSPGKSYTFQVRAYAAVGGERLNGYTSEVTKKIYQGKSIEKMKISLLKTAYRYNGELKTPSVKVKDGLFTLKADKDYTVTYRNNRNAGTGIATITGRGKYSGRVTRSFQIYRAKMEDCTVSVSGSGYTYTGSAITPQITVKQGARKLAAGTDYSVKYQNNVNAGTAKIIVTGKGNYTGTATKTFVIQPLNLEKCDVSLPDGDSYAYTGEEVRPAVSVKYNGTQISFEPSRTFSLDYQNNIECGTATVTVKGAGNLTGKKTLQFKIEEKFIWPCQSSYTVTTLYYYKDGKQHSTSYGYNRSIDIGGGGNIVAIADGVVEKAVGMTTSYGYHVIIRHEDGSRSLYAHMKAGSLQVRTGDKVKQGQVLGVMGQTGNADGIHLHFEYSKEDLMMTFYKDQYKEKLVFEQNVHDNNEKYNADKSIVKWIEAHYAKKSGDIYYRYVG